MTKVEISRQAYRSLFKLPSYIVSKLKTWIAQVEHIGIYAVRKRTGFHDEPLQGKRVGQRSIRLNQAYRAIYVETRKGQLILLTVIEVNKHEY